MVYGVFGGCYSDWYIVGYFDNCDDAEKYCCISNADYYVKPLKKFNKWKRSVEGRIKVYSWGSFWLW